MSTPGQILSWIFDGSRKYTRKPELLTPPPCGNPENFASRTSPERSVTEEDDDEFYDPSVVPDDPIWNRYDKEKVKALPSRPSTPPATQPKSVAQNILYGGYHIATFKDTSYNSRGGSSACGLASLNAIRLAFRLYEEIRNGEELVTKLVSEDFTRDAMALAASWLDLAQPEVESILELPIFSTAFQVLDVQYRELRYRTFSDLLLSLKPEEESTGPRAACLTRTPEIIAIVCMPITGFENDAIAPAHRRQVDSVYLVFDSHPRPNHPNGTGIQVFPPNPIDHVAEYLMDLFQIDEALVNDPHLQWQAQLLGQVSYHVLAPAKTRETPTEYDLNIGILKLLIETKRQIEDEQTGKRELQKQSRLMEQEISRLKRANKRIQDEIKELKTLVKPALPCRSDDTTGGQDDYNGHDLKGKGYDRMQSAPMLKPGRSQDSRPDVSPWQKTTDRLGALLAKPSQHPDAQSHAMLAASSRIVANEPSKSRAADIDAQVSKMMRVLERALVAQREIDQRNEAFALGALISPMEEPPQFDCCRICMENFVGEDIAIVEGCGHLCCRDCMRSVIQSKIEERRYPIPCPFCMADADMSSPVGTKGTIQAGLVETIGIPAELFEIFTEMQLAEHSVLINCRKCSGSAFVDRRDYDRIEVVTCPIAGCSHTWCKQCNQTVEGNAKHSCDGSAELESLIHKQGWKHCPGCRTPVEKISGCNHMSCKTPGCNVHFCYRCDVVISRGGTTADMLSAKSSHYRSCVLH